MDPHNFSRLPPPYNRSTSSEGSSTHSASGGNAANHPHPPPIAAVGSQRTSDSSSLLYGNVHHHHPHANSHGHVVVPAPVAPPPGQNIWLARGGAAVVASSVAASVAAPVGGEIGGAEDRIFRGLGDATANGRGHQNGCSNGHQSNDVKEVAMAVAVAPRPGGNNGGSEDSSATVGDDGASLPEYRGEDQPPPDMMMGEDEDPSNLSIIAPCRNLTDAFERMYVDHKDGPCDGGAAANGAGNGVEGMARSERRDEAATRPEDREDVEQSRGCVGNDGSAATPNNGGKAADGEGGKDGLDAISPAGVDELDLEKGQQLEQKEQQLEQKEQQLARQPSQEGHTADAAGGAKFAGGAERINAGRGATPSGQMTFQQQQQQQQVGGGHRPPPQDDPRKSRPPQRKDPVAKTAAAPEPQPHSFSLVPALMLDLPQPVVSRVSFYSVIHDINKEAAGMAANDHSNFHKNGGGSEGGADGGNAGGEPPKDEETHPLVVAVNGLPPPKPAPSDIGGGADAAATPAAAPKNKGSSFVHAAAVDEEKWLLSAIAARSPDEVSRELRACPSTFAEAIGEQEAGEAGSTEAGTSGGGGGGGKSSGQTANPLSSLMNSRTQLWKPSRSWWEAKSGKNPWIEPNSHNKRWRYLWPLIHYHKFLARCIKKLKRNGVDVKTSLSPVSAFLREEVCAVSDHLAAASKFTADEWMAALAPFEGWTDRSAAAEANLRELVRRQKLRAIDEPGDVDSPLLRSQIDEQFLRVMAAQREQMANGGLTHDGVGGGGAGGGRAPEGGRPPMHHRQPNSNRFGPTHGMPPMHGRPPMYNHHPPGHRPFGNPPLHPGTGMDQRNQGGGSRRNRKQRQGGGRGAAIGGRGGWNQPHHHPPSYGAPHHNHGMMHNMYHHPQPYGHHPNGGYGMYGGQYYPPAYGHHHPPANAMSHGNYYHGGGYHGHEGYSMPNSYPTGHQAAGSWGQHQDGSAAHQYGDMGHHQGSTETYNAPEAETPLVNPGTPMQIPEGTVPTPPEQLDTSVDSVDPSSYKSPGDGAPPPSPFWGHLNLSSMPGLETPMTHATPGGVKRGGGQKGRGSFAGGSDDGEHHDGYDEQWLGLAYGGAATYRHGFAPPSPATQFQQSDTSTGWAQQSHHAYGGDSGAAMMHPPAAHGEHAEDEPSSLNVSLEVPPPPEVKKVTSPPADEGPSAEAATTAVDPEP